MVYTFDNSTIHYFESQYNELQHKHSEKRMNMTKHSKSLDSFMKKIQSTSQNESNTNTNIKVTSHNKNLAKKQSNVFMRKDDYGNDFNFLFWCYYVFKHHQLDENVMSFIEVFESISPFKVEQKEKYEAIDNFRENSQNYKALSKLHKLKVSIDDAINDLGCSKHIDLKTFFILLFSCNENVALIDGKKMKLVQMNDSTQDFYKLDIRNKELYRIPENYEELQNKYFIVDNLEKPVKSEGYYKIADLKEIATILNISLTNELGKSKTKKVLYQSISETLKN